MKIFSFARAWSLMTKFSVDVRSEATGAIVPIDSHKVHNTWKIDVEIRIRFVKVLFPVESLILDMYLTHF